MLSFIVKEVIDISYSKLIKTIAAAVTEQTEKMIKAKTNSDRSFNAQISEIVNDNKCRIKYCGNYYTISSSIYCEENDWVRVCAPCDNWKELYVVENKTKGKTLRDMFSSIKELNTVQASQQAALAQLNGEAVKNKIEPWIRIRQNQSLLEVSKALLGKDSGMCGFEIEEHTSDSPSTATYPTGLILHRKDTLTIILFDRNSSDIFTKSWNAREWSGWKKYSGTPV